MLNLNQLHTFVTCAEQGSFSAGARKLGKAQSVVSQAIANLEIDLDQALFDRSGRSPVLTPAGNRMLEHAKAILAQAQEMEQAALSLSMGAETEIVMCVDNALLTPPLLKMLSEFRSRFKATHLELHVVENRQIAPKIKAGKAHLGLMLLDPHLMIGVEQSFIGKVDFFTAVHPGHPLASYPEISRGDLSRYPQIVLSSRESALPDYAPVISPELISCNDFQMMGQLAAASLGWTYIPAHIAQPLIDEGKLAKVDVLFDTKTWQVPVDRITQLGSVRGPALSWLMSATEQVFS